MITKDLGMVTAYAYAVSKGYTGTEEEFAELMASYASVAQEAVDAALAAAQSAQAAESAKDTAQTTVDGAIAGIQAEGQTQIGAVQSEGTTQVGNVNSAGTTQVDAVQAKGAEVLDSIPSDYTALSGEVSGLKSAINELPKYEFPGFDVKTEEHTPQWPEGGKIEFDSNIGYIAKTDGQVKNAGTGTWIYSDFIPMSRLDGTVGNFTLHTSVACVSYYSEADFNSWLGHLSITSEYDPTYSKNDVLNNAPTGSAFIVICTDGARNELYAYLTAETAYTETVITNLPVFGKKIMHISFDDTNNAFADLTTNANTYTSLFDSPFFAVLKEMHDTYGAVFSCYCFYSVYTDDTRGTLVFTLANCTTKFKDEFEANSDWLRFGFHSIDNYKEYTNVSESDATADWNTFINGIIPVVGLKCIDTLVRIQSFTGGQNACRGFRNGLCGARGFLSSDYSETGDNKNIDSSNGYYLSTAQSKICGRMGKYYEPTEALYFFPSNWRIDWQTDLPGYLALFNTADRFNRSRYMIMYGHENTMTRSEGDIAAYRTKLITVCQWANNNGYVFAFPADLISY